MDVMPVIMKPMTVPMMNRGMKYPIRLLFVSVGVVFLLSTSGIEKMMKVRMMSPMRPEPAKVRRHPPST